MGCSPGQSQRQRSGSRNGPIDGSSPYGASPIISGRMADVLRPVRRLI